MGKAYDPLERPFLGVHYEPVPRWLAIMLVSAASFFFACTRGHDPLPGFPKLVLWAWERPEDLSYIVPRMTGVAYLADTLTFKPSGFERYPRAQPLRVPKQTPLMAVIRIESHGSNRPLTQDVVSEILRVTHDDRIRAVQIDYDARQSERTYYRALMDSLHRQLSARVPVEMTSLVSWCENDDWIRHMPVVDAVPMFFRMGRDPHSTHETLREPLCASSIGISTDEFYVPVPRGKRVFVFTDQGWTETKYRAVLQAAKRWS